MTTSQQHNPTKPVTSNIRVPAELWGRLRLRAFEEDMSINALIVQAISEMVEAEPMSTGMQRRRCSKCGNIRLTLVERGRPFCEHCLPNP